MSFPIVYSDDTIKANNSIILSCFIFPLPILKSFTMFSPDISLVNSAIDLNIRIHHRLEHQDTKQKTFFISFFHEKRALDARDVYYVSLWICTGK